MSSLFVKTLTAADKYSRIDMQNFSQKLQAPLSLKQKTFYRFSFPFPKFASNIEHFQKKDESASLIISDIIDFGKRCYT